MASTPKVRMTLGPCRFPYRSGQTCQCKTGSCVAVLANDISGQRCDNCDHMLAVHEDYVGEPGEIQNNHVYRVPGDNSFLTPGTDVSLSNNGGRGTGSSRGSRKRRASRIQSMQDPEATATPSPSPAKEKLVHDSVIQILAVRAENNPQLKSLMRIVASGKASQEQLSGFQVHLDEISALIATGKPGQRPSTGAGNPA